MPRPAKDFILFGLFVLSLIKSLAISSHVSCFAIYFLLTVAKVLTYLLYMSESEYFVYATI